MEILKMKSFLELEGLHVFITGAAGGIGSAIVEEFLGTYISLNYTSQQLPYFYHRFHLVSIFSTCTCRGTVKL
jgi:nucleoside-diphosphate-sugar epimerase